MFVRKGLNKKNMPAGSTTTIETQLQHKRVCGAVVDDDTQPLVPLHGVCGYAPGGIPAYSNDNDSTFTAIQNFDNHFFTGYQWQCVEFARRWLLERKGLVLPEYFIAAHIIFGEHVYNLEGKPVSCRVTRNGSSTRPIADTLIIWPSSKKNVVGHIGVITEVGDNFVRVADQNRYFHAWGERGYSSQFPVVQREDGCFYIEDPDIECSGWISFPGAENRPDGLKLNIPESMKAPPRAWFGRHLGFVFRSLKEHYCGPLSDASEKQKKLRDGKNKPPQSSACCKTSNKVHDSSSSSSNDPVAVTA